MTSRRCGGRRRPALQNEAARSRLACLTLRGRRARRVPSMAARGSAGIAEREYGTSAMTGGVHVPSMAALAWALCTTLKVRHGGAMLNDTVTPAS